MNGNSRSLAFAISVICLALLFHCGAPEERPATAVKPSVLLITLDTLRADRLGCYGNTDGLTPSLDAFAERATCFLVCQAPAPLTLPSHVSILSGWEPVRHGIRINLDRTVPLEVPLLGEEFRDAGYMTSAFISAAVLLRRYGLDRGFDHYDQSFFGEGTKQRREAPAGETLDKAMAWLDQCGEPYFCWIHLYDPHDPYEPPEPYALEYKGRPYDGEVAYLDAELGRFLDRLERLPGSGETIVAICGDHGESLGEHGEAEHGIFVYESATRVPFLVRLPGQHKSQAFTQLTGLVDVAPTLRHLAGLEKVPGDGVSLAPFLEGKGYSLQRHLFLESLQGLLTYGWSPVHGIVGEKWKYILVPRPELYDLQSDPGELNNLLEEHPQVARSLQREILSHQEKIATLTAETPEGQLSDEELSDLASLGYIGSTFSISLQSESDPKDFIHLKQPIKEAKRLLFDQKNREALAILEKLLVENPENTVTHFLIGVAYQETDPDRAIEIWEKALERNPSYEVLWNSLVTLLLDTGSLDQAALRAEEGLRACPDRKGILHVALAEKAYFDGEPESAVMPLIDSALALDPGQARAYLLRGLLHSREGRHEAMKADMAEVWKHTSKEKVMRWKRDPALKEVF